MKYVLLVLSLWFSTTANAGVSAARLPNESFESAISRHLSDAQIQENGRSQDETAEHLRKPMSKVDFSETPELSSYDELVGIFNFIRDTRFLQTENPKFPRRLTWLYPDDGCYARAEVSTIEIASKAVALPKKVFAFGNLRARTNNSSSGFVSWWYHVAISYRVGAQAYILDPAIEAERPLTIEEWNNAIRGNSSYEVQYSICSAHTYDPTDGCSTPTQQSQEQIFGDQKSFLRREWSRLLQLHRKPEVELGENPPWSHH